jgi:hypothetical protein
LIHSLDLGIASFVNKCDYGQKRMPAALYVVIAKLV